MSNNPKKRKTLPNMQINVTYHPKLHYENSKDKLNISMEENLIHQIESSRIKN